MFTGFAQEAFDFLGEIRLQNNQAFYEENKQRYEAYVKAPLRELCEEMAPVVQLIDPRLDTRPGRTMSRLRRDTRFTRDKSPFRDHVWLGWRYPGEQRSEGFGMYWGFGPDWISWGCGSYATDKPLMDALRLYIRREPEQVRAILAHPEVKGRFLLYGEDYKRIAIPNDVPDDLKALYVKKGFGLEQVKADSDWALLRSHAMADRLARDLAAMAPLQQMMQRLRAQALHAQAQQAAQRLSSAQTPAAPKPVTVRATDEFEF